MCPPFSTSGPGLYVGAGLTPACFHPKDARKGFRPAGQNPSGTGTGVERPLIRHGICRDTFPLWGKAFRAAGSRPYGDPFSLCVGVRIVCPPFSTSGPGLYVGAGLAPARFHPKDARKGFRPAGQNPSGTGTGVERPLIRHGICRDTFPLWGEGFSGGWKPPLRGPLQSLRRGAQSAPAVLHRPFHRAHRAPVENFLGSEEGPGKPCGFPGPCF